MKIRILSTIVCYKNEYEVIEFCKMLFLLQNSDQIAVSIGVNCFSESYDEKQFRRDLSDISDKISVDVFEKNIGYLNGMLEAYRFYMQNTLEETDIDWVIMSNTDIEIISNNLITYLQTNTYKKEIVCIAPKIERVNSSGYEVNYKNRHKKKKLKLLCLLCKYPILDLIYKKMHMFKSKKTELPEYEAGIIYEAHGSFFFIKNNFMPKLLNEEWPFLMYNEEAFISDIVYKNKCLEFYDPSIEVRHEGSTSTGKLSNKTKLKMKEETYKFLLKRYS